MRRSPDTIITEGHPRPCQHQETPGEKVHRDHHYPGTPEGLQQQESRSEGREPSFSACAREEISRQTCSGHTLISTASLVSHIKWDSPRMQHQEGVFPLRGEGNISVAILQQTALRWSPAGFQNLGAAPLRDAPQGDVGTRYLPLPIVAGS